MDITSVVICWAAALLAGITFEACHGYSTGTEFITTFIPNYFEYGKKDLSLKVVLNAQGSEAEVDIQVDVPKFSKRLTLPADTSVSVSLPIGSELQKQFINEKSAVRISSNAKISVVSFNQRSTTGDSTVVLPEQKLGTHYFVYTPSAGPPKMHKLFAIVNGKKLNEITIKPGADVMLKGGTRWWRDKKVTITLEPYASYLVLSHACLTGTEIQSMYPVAVLTGHQCMYLRARCDHVYEQLHPVESLGTEYLVPMTYPKTINWATVVATKDSTVVTIQGAHHSTKQDLKKAGDFTKYQFSHKQPIFVKSNKKVMVMLLSNNKASFIMRLTPIHRFATDWAVETGDGIHSTVAIVSEREGAGSVKVCVRGKCSSPHWHTYHFKQWVWSNVAVGSKQNRVTVEGDSEMAVYVYGGKKRYAYGTAGICTEGATTPVRPKDPCEEVKCRVKEHCVNGKCVHVSTATCHALGDPHYRTFDGQHYDFQGTCTYIMATTVAKMPSDLLPFNVTSKNNHRGSRKVSFVRTVTVSVQTQTVVIGIHKGRALVNGELQYLPISLQGGLVKVEQSGIYAVLSTNFGLTVKYDWNNRLYITVPSSYYQHLGGLCGNYNGNKNDDLPEGHRPDSVLKMVKMWKVADSDKFCHDDCEGNCPQCTAKQQARFSRPKICGILIKEDGPFSACHKDVDPNLFMDNCVYDVCVNKGSKRVLCDNLKSYEDNCVSEGGNVSSQWRKTSKCRLSCPKGSHYEACGSACPATCASMNSKAECKAACVEGCQCNKGWVLSGDRCVRKSSCGCQYQGKYYPSGMTFWGDNTCTTQCECHEGKAKVKCVSTACKKQEVCLLKGGVRDCYPKSYATCKASGDPHYRTFDNSRFDFQGTCTYILSQLTDGSEKDLAPFQVLVQNENRGRNKAVSFTKSVTLRVFGNVTISMSRAYPKKILVNSQSVNLPYSTEDGKLSLFGHGFFGIVKTHFGLKLRFNWNSHVSLTLPSTYSTATTGLCGNYNGKRDDDLMKPDGTQATDIHVFGHSWKTGGDSGCTSDCPGGKCPTCKPALLRRYKRKEYCGIMANNKGPFKKCQEKVDHVPFLTDCVFDLCMYQGHSSALCNSLLAYSAACQDAGAEVSSWRTETFCPPSCGANSHYEVCAAPCQLTCSGLAAPEGCDDSAPCSEGCVCDEGFMMSHDKCVPLAECGCQFEGRYYQNGEVFYPGESCNNRCVCSDGGEVECDPEFQCSANEKCVVKDGVASCHPKEFGSCSVSGVRTVRSFDGQAYPLWGNCLFKLSEVEETLGGMTAFTVLVEQQTNQDGSVTRGVVLKADDNEITMEPGVTWAVKVNDISVPLPLSLDDGKVQVYQNGISIIAETDFGLRLTYDCEAGILLHIPSTYRTSLQGLCGNYNGRGSDDLGSPKKSPADMAAAWVEDQIHCKPGCGAHPCPGPDITKTPEAEKACDIIKAQKGPFVGCHSTVSPTPDYDACVREMSTGKADKQILCLHIQSYVTSCQLAGAKIKKWRTKDFCPLTCASGSHYELCSSSCSSTCSSLEQSGPCPVCQEGCQCDEDLMADGARCVPVEDCGCVVEGLYYKSNASVLQEDCSEVCSCQSGHFRCDSTNCKEGTECRNVNGELGCHPKDPCAVIRCREKEHCKVSEGQAECVSNYTASCTAFGDPHYITFDGWRYSFQGTCTYVLVNTTGVDRSLPTVTVTTKNELRGNSKFSYVRLLVVEMLGHTISIPTNKKGSMLVDGIETELPATLEEGRLTLKQVGMKGVVQSDIGVEVTFDWATRVKVTMSSSYFGNVVGLCGNYNDNKEDELTVANGVASNVLAWARTWSVADDDPFCYHHCEGVCPRCSEEERVRFSGPKYCGILSNKTGPFSNCHNKVPVAEFVSDCLYDVCVSKSKTEALCNALSGYVSECEDAGASLKQWRQQTNCSVGCPAHSHYEVCGSACPPSCGPQPGTCTQDCVEGCFCDKGYVRSGTKCVLKSECGCSLMNKYYLPGAVFWADAECKQRCECDAKTQKVMCRQTGCRSGEKCSIVSGVQDCHPVDSATCTAHGDQHFTTFDGRTFDFHGNCVFKLASVCGGAEGLQQFEVNLENNNRAKKRKSYAKVVTVKVYGVTYRLSVDHPEGVLVDGIEQSLPFSRSQSLIQVYRNYRQTVIETKFLKVSFDLASAVRVEVATSYRGSTCGLCGNFNNDPADDLKLPNGKLASDAKTFGASQWVANVEGCSRECKNCVMRPPDFKPPSSKSVCNLITDKDGPLADCVGRINSKEFYEECTYDVALHDGNTESACHVISNYVEECQRKGGSVKEWRKKKLCRMTCPRKSKYNVSAPGCPPSCTSRALSKECKATPSEGCVCDDGLVLSQGRCVQPANCGCFFKGPYLKSGKAFYEDSKCQSYCACRGGVMSCRDKPCKNKKKCGMKNGERSCVKG